MITILDRTSGWAVIHVPAEDVPSVKPIIPSINDKKESTLYINEKGKVIAYQVRIKAYLFDKLKEALGEGAFRRA